MSEIFFTSDTHFGHANIIRFCNRPFANATEMDETMIANWNSRVGTHDTVYHLGDFSFLPAKETANIRRRLNGSICLLLGNHDKQPSPRLFEWIKGVYQLKVSRDGLGTQEIALCHYGQRTWVHDIRGAWHLYGHSHGQLPPYGKSVDVGVDSWNFTPVHFSEIEKFMDKREIANHPMFENFVKEAK